MGIEISHGCWDGSASSFHNWRRTVAMAIGIDLPKMKGFGGNRSWFWLRLKGEPLEKLLNLPDSQVDIEVADCLRIAERLERLLPAIKQLEPDFGEQEKSTLRFVAGLRRAAKAGENISSC